MPALQVNNPITAAASASQRVTREVVTPVQVDSDAAIEFDEAIGAIREGIAESNVLLAKQKEITTDITSVQETKADAIENQADSKKVIVQQEQLAAMKAQNDARRIFEAAGGVDQLVKLAAAKKAATDEALVQLQEVADLTNVDINKDGFFDWLGAQFQLPFEQEEAAAALTQVKAADNAIDTVTAQVNNTQAALSKVQESKTTATVAALSDSIAQQAVIEASEARLKSQLTRAEALTQSMRMNAQQMDATIKGYQLGIQKEELKESKLDRKARRLEVGKSAEIDDAIVRNVQAGQVKLGIPPGDRGTILAMTKLKGESQLRAGSLFDIGSDSVVSTPADTFIAFNINKAASLLDKSNPALTAVKNAVGTTTESLTKLGKKPTEAELKTAVNSQTLADFEGFEKKIKDGDETNPNVAAPLPALLEASLLKDSAFTKKVLAPLNLEKASPTHLVKLAVGAIEEGTISIEEAVQGINLIYTQAVVYNNVTQNRENLGLPVQKAYNTPIVLPGTIEAGRTGAAAIAPRVLFTGYDYFFDTEFTDTEKVIDFLSPTSVKEAVIKYLSAKKKGSPVFDKL